MKKLIGLFFLLIGWLAFSLPGKIIESDHKVAYISLESIDLSTCNILKEFKLENIPTPGDPIFHAEFHKNSNRIVYITKDKRFVFKIWQKNYHHMKQFLHAYHANFYDDVSLISALIFDQEEECRGYVTPYMIDRTFNREKWDTNGFVLEKNRIGVNIFSSYNQQPDIYKKLFNQLVDKTKNTGLMMMDFCPNNCAMDPKTGNLYLIDLEDVDCVSTFQKLINETYVYNPLDYATLVSKKF